MLRYFIRLSGRRHFSAFSSHTTGVVNTPTIKVCIIDGKRRTSFAALDDHYRRSILPPPPGLSILPNVFGFLADHTNGSAYPMGCVSVCLCVVFVYGGQTHKRVVLFLLWHKGYHGEPLLRIIQRSRSVHRKEGLPRRWGVEVRKWSAVAWSRSSNPAVDERLLIHRLIVG